MRRTILLADDSPTIQRLVTHTFADADIELVSVSNGEAAIRKFEEIHPHVVLADIYMPGKTGYEVCSHIRQHPAVGNTPVILLVGAFDLFDESKAKDIGATGHITKPFEPQALYTLVESVLPPEEVALEETATAVTREIETKIEPPPEPESESLNNSQKLEIEDRTPVKVAVGEKGHTEPVEELIPISPFEEVAGRPPAAEQEHDLLGLETLFPAPEPPQPAEVTSLDIDRIADRVVQKISSQVIESIAWELVPDIAEKIVREELRRTRES